MTELLQLEAADGLGQEQGAEGQGVAPPGTSDVIGCATQMHQCYMYHVNWGLFLPHGRIPGESFDEANGKVFERQCSAAAYGDNTFCDVHSKVRLCKASGIDFMWNGNCGLGLMQTIPPHPLQPGCTRRAQFCSDRCRNLHRDSAPRRIREWALEIGEVPVGYSVIENYRNSGKNVLLSDKTGRIQR